MRTASLLKSAPAALVLCVSAALITSCSSGGMYGSMSSSGSGSTMANNSVLNQLVTVQTVGSTVDPVNGDNNPYGLAIEPVTAGTETMGNLMVCNFNDSMGNAGNGTTMVQLSPMPGSKPTRFAQDPSLKGCDAIAINTKAGFPWVAAYTAMDNPIVSTSGSVVNTLATAYTWMHPWGQVYAVPAATLTMAVPTFYVTDAGDGSVVAIRITSSGFMFQKIAKGFPTNLTSAYGILAPAGLTYDQPSDTLYVVSSDTNSIVALTNASTLTDGGITVGGTASTGLSFTGPMASHAKVIYNGSPLNYPVSMAELYNGDLIVGNTGDNNMIEITPTGLVVATKLVDSGSAGAIFGIATAGTSVDTQVIFFNDDNTNSVVAISLAGSTASMGGSSSGNPYTKNKGM